MSVQRPDLSRFFVDPERIGESEVRITGSTARKICTVLRLGCGDRILAMDGNGRGFVVKIASASSAEVVGQIERRLTVDTEPEVRLTLAQSLPKADKLEFVIQKGVELGVARFEVIATDRTVAKPSNERIENRLARWRTIAKEAAEQSFRAYVPEVDGIADFGSLVSQVSEYDLAICLWEDEDQMSLREVLKDNLSARNVLAIVGPEGGLTQEEAAELKSAGAYTASLGARILRSETAAIAAATIILYELDGRWAYPSNEKKVSV